MTESAKAKAELAELKTLDKNSSNEYERLKQAAETAQNEAEQLRSELQVLHAFLTEDKDLEKNAGIQKCTGCGKSKSFSGTKQGFF